MALSADQLEEFHRIGYIVVEDLFTPDEMRLALAEMEAIFYGTSFKNYLQQFDAGKATGSVEPTPSVAVPHYGNTEHGRAQFPTGATALDRLVENDVYLDTFEQCLGGQASYCNAHLFLRSGPTDKRHSEHTWEGYHMDHFTNCFLPPNSSPNLFSYVNSGVYLHDVDDDGAPMNVIPGSHRQVAELFSRMAREGILVEGSIHDIRRVEDFAQPVPTSAKAGSALFYSSYLVHAAVPFQNKRKQRAFWTLSMCRADNSTWTKLANPWVGPERQLIRPFWEQTTPRVRSLFGWPAPGHPYYDTATLKNISALFPEMDLGPYAQSA